MRTVQYVAHEGEVVERCSCVLRQGFLRATEGGVFKLYTHSEGATVALFTLRKTSVVNSARKMKLSAVIDRCSSNLETA